MKPCDSEIKRNIMNVELGLPLTQPLATLNLSCDFREFYEKFSGGTIGHVKRNRKLTEEEIRVRKKEYEKTRRQTPEYKAYQKAYYQRPEVKARNKAYYQRRKEEHNVTLLSN